MLHPTRRVLTLSSIALVSAALCLGAKPFLPQSSPTPPTTANAQPQPVPLSHLYMHFLLYQAHLQHIIAANPADPRAARISESLRKKIGLSADQWQSVLTSSLRMETAVHSADPQVQTLRKADLDALKMSPNLDPANAPYRPQLRAMEAQRRQVIEAENARLNGELGPDAAAKLRIYLQAATAGATRALPHSHKDPASGTTPGGAK